MLSTIEENEPDDIANEIKCISTETAQKHLRKSERKEETLGKVKHRKEAKRTSGAHSNNYKAIAKEAKQVCRKDKEKYLTRKCQKIKDLMKENKSREMHNE